jgi:hypothetical protein
MGRKYPATHSIVLDGFGGQRYALGCTMDRKVRPMILLSLCAAKLSFTPVAAILSNVAPEMKKMKVSLAITNLSHWLIPAFLVWR